MAETDLESRRRESIKRFLHSGDETLLEATPEESGAISNFLRSDKPLEEFLPTGQNLAPRTDKALRMIQGKEPPHPEQVDVPISEREGLGAWHRLQLSFRETTEAKKAYLEEKFPGKVRFTGKEFYIKTQDRTTGKEKEIPLDEEQMTLKDLLDVANRAPDLAADLILETAGGFGGVSLLRRIPGLAKEVGKLKTIRDIFGFALGSGAVAAGQKTATKVAQGEPLDIDILKEAGGRLTFDLGADFFLTGSAKIGKKLLNFGLPGMAASQTEIQRAALRSIENVKRKHNIEVPLSLAEETGSPAGMAAESMLETLPGGRSLLIEQKRRGEEAMLDLERVVMGPEVLPGDEADNLIIDTLGRKARTAEAATDMQAAKLNEVVRQELEDSISKSTVPQRLIYTSEIGSQQRKAVVLEREQFKLKNREQYGEFYAFPEANEAFVPMAGVNQKLKEVKRDLPKKTLTKEVDTGLVDERGQPITRTEESRQVLEDWLASPVKRIIDEGLDQKMPYREVIQLRESVNDWIDRDKEGLIGISTGYLKELSHAMTDSMQAGVAQLPSGPREALEKANAYYRQNNEKFRAIGVAELFRAPDVAGSVGDAALVARISEGLDIDRYGKLKDVIGHTPEFKLLKGSIADNIMGKATSKVDDKTLDAGQFITGLKRLRDNAREIYDDIFKDTYEDIFKSAETLRQAQEFVGGKLDVGELLEAAKKGQVDRAKLVSLIQSKTAQDKLYANELIRRAAKDELDPSKLKPGELSNALFSENISTAEVAQIVGELQSHPKALEALQRKSAMEFFDRAAREPSIEDAMRFLSGDPTAISSGESLAKVLKDERFVKKLKTVLGPESWETLQDYTNIALAKGVKSAVGKTVGSLARGGLINAILNGPGIRTTLSISKYKFASWLLTSPTVRPILRRNMQLPEVPGVTMALIASTPFLNAVIDEFGEEGGMFAYLNDLRNGAYQWIESQGKERPPIKLEQEVEGEGVIVER